MSGHNKWSKIKNKKAVEDAQKSKVFSMNAQTIATESRKAGGDKTAPNLRAAVERAREANLPNDNIERAIARGISADAGALQEVVYEAYGPGGIAFLLEGVTDNPNRTTPEIRHLLSIHGGHLGAQGSVAWAFTKEGDTYKAITPVPVTESNRNPLLALYAALDEQEDIKNIHTNADMKFE